MNKVATQESSHQTIPNDHYYYKHKDSKKLVSIKVLPKEDLFEVVVRDITSENPSDNLNLTIEDFNHQYIFYNP